MAETKDQKPEAKKPITKLEDAFIKDVLLKGQYVSTDDMTRAEEYAKSHHSPITDYLFNAELLNKGLLGHAIAEALGVKYVDLSQNPPSKATITKLPKTIAEQSRVILIDDTSDILIATDTTDPKAAIEAVASLFPGKKISVAWTFGADMERAFPLYKEALAVRFTEIIKREQKVAPEIVEQIVEDAILLRASDIHLEPQETEVLVRFRIDGVLEEAGTLPKLQYENILNRIKIEARLRIDEHMRSQDGAIRYHKGTNAADLRVSIVPTVSGEKVVMRLLGEYLRTLTLADIGLSQKHQALLTEIANRPYGMILTAGPTGSGKTTTLYSILRLLNDSTVNVTTIEDPVEYRIGRINQVQVNDATGLTFASGLRTVVRQDPDVILVGEIRDFETAEISVNAALTGHLLLSTFHANDASTVVPRLLDMKVEPFLLASTLSVIIAQRLIRRICAHCKVSETVTVASLIEEMPKLQPFLTGTELIVYKGKGCDKCNHTGFKGQSGIFEFIEVTSKVGDVILRDSSAEAIEKAAREEGTKSFFEDGLDKVLAGITTFEELLRVALPPKILEQK
ncbi:MAG: type pilus assembly protein PilB [Patescibacteria group bacterium]|nr:type pilus assembly protein PilB [Patescibacteria group bacterium]